MREIHDEKWFEDYFNAAFSQNGFLALSCCSLIMVAIMFGMSFYLASALWFLLYFLETYCLLRKHIAYQDLKNRVLQNFHNNASVVKSVKAFALEAKEFAGSSPARGTKQKRKI